MVRRRFFSAVSNHEAQPLFPWWSCRAPGQGSIDQTKLEWEDDLPSLSPCGRGWTRCEAARTGEGSVSANTECAVRDPSSDPRFARITFSHKGRRKKARTLARLAKGQIDALAAQHGVFAIGQRRDTVEEQPRRPAPYRDVGMVQPKATRLVAALDAHATEKCGHRQRPPG